MLRKWVLFGGLAVAIATTAIVGCNTSESPVEKAAGPQPGPAKAEEEHGHKPGSHGGIIVPLGRDSYHLEAVFVKNGTVRLHVLGKDEAKLHEIDVQDVIAYVTPAGSPDAEEVKFVAQPQPGDSAGKTSLFVAQLPEPLKGKTVKVVINNIQFGPGERFRLDFTNEQATHDEAAMPGGVTSDEAKKLYLTPGGKYTQADIKANGNTIPLLKFKGIKSEHSVKLQPGDKICPISNTKANPKFTWVVGGKTYEFCCVPCIDEFVLTAKEKPDEIKDPSEYIKK